MQKTTIRPAVQSDVPALAKLAAATFTETFGHLYAPADLQAFLTSARSEAAYAPMLAGDSTRAWLAFTPDAPAPAGYCIAGPCKLPVLEVSSKAGEVRELYVLKAFQQHRLGTQLLATAIEWLNMQGHAPLHVGVWSQNHGAQRLYGRFGFEKTGEYDFPVGNQLDREFILTRSAAT